MSLVRRAERLFRSRLARLRTDAEATEAKATSADEMAKDHESRIAELESDNDQNKSDIAAIKQTLGL